MLLEQSLLPESINTNVSNWQSDMDEMIDRGMARVRRSHEQLIAQGLYDKHGTGSPQRSLMTCALAPGAMSEGRPEFYIVVNPSANRCNALA